MNDDMKDTQISAKSISDLEFIDSLDDDKILIVAQNTVKSSELYGYLNKYITVGQLKRKLIEDIKAETEAESEYGSMITQNKDDYAKVQHTHEGYNSCSVQVKQSGEHFGTVAINGNYIKLRDISFQMEQYPEYMIGQLRFVAHTKRMTYDIESEEFDGWVYADGTRYETTGFSKAKQYFVSDSNSFTVPNLTSFVKCKNDGTTAVRSGNYIDTIPYNISVVQHTHTIKPTVKGKKKDIAFNVDAYASNGTAKTSGTAGTYPLCYNNSNSEISLKVNDVLQVSKFKITKLQTTKNGKPQETHPIHDILQVMIYIGRKTYD